jgi:hypothetical protein
LRKKRAGDIPPAGPHARPELTDESKTPGSGMFPPASDEQGGNMQPTG